MNQAPRAVNFEKSKEEKLLKSSGLVLAEFVDAFQMFTKEILTLEKTELEKYVYEGFSADAIVKIWRDLSEDSRSAVGCWLIKRGPKVKKNKKASGQPQYAKLINIEKQIHKQGVTLSQFSNLFGVGFAVAVKENTNIPLRCYLEGTPRIWSWTSVQYMSAYEEMEEFQIYRSCHLSKVFSKGKGASKEVQTVGELLTYLALSRTEESRAVFRLQFLYHSVKPELPTDDLRTKLREWVEQAKANKGEKSVASLSFDVAMTSADWLDQK